MKVLIVGSKGFIGGHTANFFNLMPDTKVYECDVVVDYEKENYFLIDSTNADYHSIFQNHTFDACINCSGAASVPDSLKNPFRDFTLNTYNVVKLLDAIRLNQPDCKFINLSSAAIYGNPSKLPIQENLPCKPISPYGVHKAQAEEICSSFSTYYNIPTCSLRIFSAYGNGLKKQLFWDLFQKARKSDRIELFGTGLETRDFIHVDDVCRAIQCSLNGAAFKGETINVANGQEVTISHAVNTFYSFFGHGKHVTFNGQVKKGDPLNWQADISLLETMGYSQSVKLEEGLLNYYLWISQL